MGYTVLARRYRSQSFDDVVGQDSIAQTMKNAIKSEKVAHAYLFSGTRGVGKTTMARILAKALNCLNSDAPTTKPCCECDSCLAINIGEDIDVIEIDGASNRGIDSIRELRQNAIYRPARARYKIYIIDEVHMLTNEAFNALLKILEEPPEHVKFIFATTEPNKVLATIQSRCQRFDFNNIAPATIAAQLKKVLKSEKIKFQDDLIIGLAKMANGSMRDGLSLLDQLISTGRQPLTLEMLEEFLGKPNSEKICDLVEKIGNSDPAAVLITADEMLNAGQTCIQILDTLIDFMRDLMVTKSTDEKSSMLILTNREREKMAALAPKFDIPAIIYNITTLEKLRWTIKNSDNPRALLEAALLRLALAEHFLSVPALLNQLNKGSGGVAGPIKKKFTPPAPTPAKVNQPIQSIPTQAQAAPSPANTPQNWPDILTEVRLRDANIAGLLESANEPATINGGSLTISFLKANEFAKAMCENKSEIITSLLSDILARPITLKFWIIPSPSTNAAAQPQETPAKIPTAAPTNTPAPKPAKTPAINESDKDQALNDPAVKTLLRGLNATVTQIDEVKEN